MLNLESQLAASKADEGNIQAKIDSAEAQLADAKWELSQTTYYAPANGTVIALTLRPGAMAVPLPMTPAMNFVEDEQWILAIYQSERGPQDQAGSGGGDRLQDVSGPHREMQSGLDHVGHRAGAVAHRHHEPRGRCRPHPASSLAVRLLPDAKDKDIFLAAGANGAGAVYTDSGEAIQILRKIMVRVSAKLDWLILKLH